MRRLIDAADPLVVVTFGVEALEAVGRVENHGLKLKSLNWWEPDSRRVRRDRAQSSDPEHTSR